MLEDCNTAGYVIIDTTFGDEGELSNLGRHGYKLPGKEVKKDDLVVLYTKAAKTTNNPERQSKDNNYTLHFFYWGRGKTVWNEGGDYCTLLYIVDGKAV